MEDTEGDGLETQEALETQKNRTEGEVAEGEILAENDRHISRVAGHWKGDCPARNLAEHAHDVVHEGAVVAAAVEVLYNPDESEVRVGAEDLERARAAGEESSTGKGQG